MQISAIIANADRRLLLLGQSMALQFIQI